MIIKEITPSILEQIIRGAAADAAAKERHPIAPDIAAVALRNARKHWDTPNEFKPDDLVTPVPTSPVWKQTLGVALVLRTYDLEEEPTGTHGLFFQHNMRVLALNQDGSAQELAVHSRDFEHAKV